MTVNRTLLTALIIALASISALAAYGTDGSPPAYRIMKMGEGARLSGDHQQGVTGSLLARPFTAKVVDEFGNPIEGVRVFFQIVDTPEHAVGHTILPITQVTDSNGLAMAQLTLGSQPGEYNVSASIRTSELDSFVVFSAHAQRKNWVVMLLIGLLGGLALFLMGLGLMSSGLKHGSGERIRSTLGKLSQNRFYATGFGAFITAVTQSSSATIVMLVGFVQSGLLRFHQTIGMMLGAAIGTTITVQLIAFNLADYALLIVAMGFTIQAIGKRDTVRFVGEAILGFGILFYGMHIMSEAMAPFRTYEPFIDLLARLEMPILGIIAGAIFTAIIQSSSAFVGIVITLSMQGFISLEASIPMLLGANLGTTITGIIASLNASRQAQKVALAYTLFKVVGILLMVGFIQPFAEFIRLITPSDITAGGAYANNTPRLIANAHTIYNVLIALVFLPFTRSYAMLIDRILPAPAPSPPAFRVKYLDKNLLNTPPVALKLAKQEVIRLYELVEDMVDDIIVPFISKDNSLCAKIERSERKTDFLSDQINAYLLSLTQQDVTDKDIQEAFQIMYVAKELEQIADLVSKNLLERARSWLITSYEFSDDGREELLEFHKFTQKQLKRAKGVFTDLNLEKARKLESKYASYKEFGLELERQHFARLSDDVGRSISSSKTHLELVSMFRTIGSHSNNIAQVILNWNLKHSSSFRVDGSESGV